MTTWHYFKENNSDLVHSKRGSLEEWKSYECI